MICMKPDGRICFEKKRKDRGLKNEEEKNICREDHIPAPGLEQLAAEAQPEGTAAARRRRLAESRYV